MKRHARIAILNKDGQTSNAIISSIIEKVGDEKVGEKIAEQFMMTMYEDIHIYGNTHED